MTVAEIVTNTIIKKLKQGEVAWHKSWSCNSPINYVTQKEYRGINRLLLGGGEYLTFKQIQNIKGAKLHKGAKSHIVVYYQSSKVVEDEENEGESKVSHMILRYYRVFNINDVEGVESKRKHATNDNIFKIDTCENVVNDYASSYDVSIRHDNKDSAYFIPDCNMVNVPPMEQFDSAEEYYSTLFHELVHSTGSKSRLNREIGGKFGSKSYAREELVAEIGSAILCSMLNISEKTFDNSSAYIQSWLKALENDTHLILYASAKAEKAVQMIYPNSEELDSVA